MRAKLVFSVISIASALVASVARADRVAETHIHVATKDASALDAELRSALVSLGHTTLDAQPLPADAPDEGSTAGCVDLGKAMTVDWVVGVDATPGNARHVVVHACQVSSGRVETLERDLEAKTPVAAQLAEMLKLMLRPQGVGDDPLPWDSAAPPPVPAPAPTPAPAPALAAAPPPELRPEPSGARWSVGFSGSAHDLLARPSAVVGSRAVGSASLVAAWAFLPDTRSVEALLRVGNFFGPGPALRAELGGRILPLISRVIALGGGASFGAFAETSGNKTARALFGVDATIALFPTSRWRLDLDFASLRVAPGDGGALVFLGAQASIFFRF